MISEVVNIKKEWTMKYLMGLIITFALGASAVAQDNRMNNSKNNKSIQKNTQKSSKQIKSSGKYREENEVVPTESQDQGNEMSKGGMRMERMGENADSLIRFENGSAEYTISPQFSSKQRSKATSLNVGENWKERLLAFADTSKKKSYRDSYDHSSAKADTSKGGYSTPSSKQSSMGQQGSSDRFDLRKQCALQSELLSKQGAFKEKKRYRDGNLLVEREKDGDEKIKFSSPTEFYKFEKNANENETYTYGAINNNESMELRKHEDGTAEIIYHAVLPSIQDAEQVLTEGFQLHNFGSVCKTMMPEEDISGSGKNESPSEEESTSSATEEPLPWR
jgi:hypothetical protein